MNKLNYEDENQVELIHAKITEAEYNERVRCVIKCLLEMSFEGDKTDAENKDFTEREAA